jgi:helicase
MPSVKLIHDKPDALVDTKDYPYGHFPFEQFNQVQSGLMDVFEDDSNVLIAAATSAGKTCMSEMFLAHEIKKRGGKGMFVVPLRALAQEKIDEWTDKSHMFGGLRTSICTGDYQLTAARKKELEAAELIIMSSEMLASRCRNMKSEKNTWLKDIGTCFVDESHLLTVPGRGDHLEVAMMKLTAMNEKLRIGFLSATLPNVDEIGRWLSVLTGKDTNLLVSKYRPCPLQIHYQPYQTQGSYDGNEEEKCAEALRLILQYRDDKFLVFAHTKRTGEMMKEILQSRGMKTEFHNANLEKDTRNRLVNEFKAKDGMRVLIATSGLAWGLNTPARRVIELGIHRGTDLVPNYDHNQMCGRAGRPKYDPAGDAYILVPSKNFDDHVENLQKPTYIESQLLNRDGENGRYKTLAFHTVAEIHHGGVQSEKDFKKWYTRSLAHHQAKDLDSEIIGNVLDSLKNCGAVKDEENKLKTTTVGSIASMFYFSPFDVSNLRKNFKALFERGKHMDDFYTAMCLANIDSCRVGIVNKAEREEMSFFTSKVHQTFGGDMPDSAIKNGYCYWLLLNGKGNAVLNNTMRALQYDFGRTGQVLQMLDQMGGKWNKKEWLTRLSKRVKSGVPEHLVYLCDLPGIAGVRAGRLFSAGLKTPADVANNAGMLKGLLKMSDDKIKEIVAAAEAITLTGK